MATDPDKQRQPAPTVPPAKPAKIGVIKAPNGAYRRARFVPYEIRQQLGDLNVVSLGINGKAILGHVVAESGLILTEEDMRYDAHWSGAFFVPL